MNQVRIRISIQSLSSSSESGTISSFGLSKGRLLRLQLRFKLYVRRWLLLVFVSSSPLMEFDVILVGCTLSTFAKYYSDNSITQKRWMSECLVTHFFHLIGSTLKNIVHFCPMAMPCHTDSHKAIYLFIYIWEPTLVCLWSAHVSDPFCFLHKHEDDDYVHSYLHRLHLKQYRRFYPPLQKQNKIRRLLRRQNCLLEISMAHKARYSTIICLIIIYYHQVLLLIFDVYKYIYVYYYLHLSTNVWIYVNTRYMTYYTWYHWFQYSDKLHFSSIPTYVDLKGHTNLRGCCWLENGHAIRLFIGLHQEHLQQKSIFNLSLYIYIYIIDR